MLIPKSTTVLRLLLAAAVVAVVAAILTRAQITHAGKTAANEFTPLFDGKALTHWRGDPTYWSVHNGVIVGGSPREIPTNTFLIRDGNFRNFELRFKYRFKVPGNSGVQFRSRTHPAGEFAVSGYQANVVTVPPSTNERFAMLYEERDRATILAANGEQTVVARKDGKVVREVVGTVNHSERTLASQKTYPEWNEQTVLAYENRFVNVLNGLLTADTTDDDVEGRAFDGFIAPQVHTGLPMEVHYKDIEIRPLTSMPDMKRFATGAPTPADAASAESSALAVGRDTFTQRCAPCHRLPGSDAPQREVLAKMSTEEIVNALVSGPMMPQATGLTRAQINAIAVYLTSGAQ